MSGSPTKDVSTSQETHTSNTASTNPAATSKQRIDEAVKTLHDSIKVISVTDCPLDEHWGRSFGGCPAAMATLKPEHIDHCKVDSQIYFDVHLLKVCKHAFEYAGEWDQASQRTFTEKAGKCPKQFAKAFLHKEIIKPMFAPKAMLEDTVQAMVDYWVVRNAQRKAVYSNREVAEEKWLKEAYSKSDMVKIEGVDLMENKPEAGDVMWTHDIQYGPPAHRCTVHMLPYGNSGGGFAVKVQGKKRCHENCPVMDDQKEYDAVRDIARRLAERYGHTVGGEVQGFANTDEFREHLKRNKTH